MKIIHTSDWHLGNNFHRHDREEEFAHFLNWLLDTLREELPDVLLIAGDVFDTPNVSARATEMFYDFLDDATQAVEGLQVVVIAGNHDSGGRLEAPQALLKRRNIYLRGLIHQTEKEETDFEHYILPLSDRHTNIAQIVCLAIPFLRSGDYPSGMTVEQGLDDFVKGLRKKLKKSPFKNLPIVACAHYYASSAQIAEEHSERIVVGGQDRVDHDIFGDDVSYVALGHIHREQKIDEHTYYSGSALPMSFSEKNYKHGVKKVILQEDGTAQVSSLYYQPLRKLISIPEKGSASVHEILAMIEDLPKRKREDRGLDWPYVELRVLENEPEPDFLHRVTEALSHRAVHFCKIIREYPHIDYTNTPTSSTEVTLQRISPKELAERVYANRYGTAMTAPLSERFEQALNEAVNEYDEI